MHAAAPGVRRPQSGEGWAPRADTHDVGATVVGIESLGSKRFVLASGRSGVVPCSGILALSVKERFEDEFK